MNRALLFVILLFTLIPLVYFPNTGHDILLMPFNIFLWEIAAATIFFGSLYIYKNKTLILPKNEILILALPLGMIFSGLITGLNTPSDWIFRLGAVLMGLLFFFSLFQYQANRRTLDNAVYIILVGMLLNAIIGLLQMLPSTPLYGLIPHTGTARAVGVFMQPNILASAMVTAILLALYQMTSPGFGKRNQAIKLLCFTTVFTASTVVISTGSRIGMISLAICIPLLLASRFQAFSLHRIRFTAALLTLAIGCTSGALMSDGLIKAYSKLERLAEEGTDARPHIYRIAWDLFTDKPIAGHGIGSFQGVFHERAAEYLAERGSAPIIGNTHYTHPHNELLFWAIEGGSIALLGIVAVVAAVLMQAWRLGWQRGGALLSLTLPIVLHSQTELPFYSSIYHWLLLMFLAFLLFRPSQHYVKLKKSEAVSALFPTTGIAILLTTLMFGTSTFFTSRDLIQFLLYERVNFVEIRKAQDNIYFNELATMLTLKLLLNEDLNNGTQNWTQRYIDWTEPYLRKKPDTASFHDLALAYNHIGNKEKAVETVERGLYLFPGNSTIAGALEKIENNTQDGNIDSAATTVTSP